jgi:hypothetical protein
MHPPSIFRLNRGRIAELQPPPSSCPVVGQAVESHHTQIHQPALCPPDVEQNSEAGEGAGVKPKGSSTRNCDCSRSSRCHGQTWSGETIAVRGPT